MKKYNLLSIILLAVTLTNCGDTKKVKILFTFDNSIVKTQYEPQDKLDLAITNDKSKAIDSVIYYINDKQVTAAE
jgi:major membrane immunogen (membrane-anchored lipoprotein)